MMWTQCENCDSWVMEGWARCYNCGWLIENNEVGGDCLGDIMDENFDKKGPIVETKISTSKDGKWVIHKTIITDIKSVNYYRAVLKDKHEKVDPAEIQDKRMGVHEGAFAKAFGDEDE